jgi:hypothetical protein
MGKRGSSAASAISTTVKKTQKSTKTVDTDAPTKGNWV